MRVLLSTIGSRGDVQPLLALALQLRDIGLDVRMCVPPDFREWIDGFGIAVVPIGPELRTISPPKAANPATPEGLRSMMEGTVATQFATITEAADGCDLIVGATGLQIAAPSIAEKLGIPYVYVAFCPAVVPSTRHAPPVLTLLGDSPSATDFERLWAEDAVRWNQMWSPFLNPQRERLDLEPIDDVRSYVLTNRPWLAADPLLAPWPGPHDSPVFQTGAWMMRDDRTLPTDVEDFLRAGAVPVYIGFGSMLVSEEAGLRIIEAVRGLGRRVIFGRGWSGLFPADQAEDCLIVDEINQQVLFGRVAAVVHHGGAGTTTVAALAGTPQVVLPQMYDQHYFAERVGALGIGAAHPPQPPTKESLTQSLGYALRPEVADRAKSLCRDVRRDGAELAARQLLALLR